MKIISNCQLCGEHYLHIPEATDDGYMQCLYCGYATSNKFKINTKLEENSEYINLPEEMKTFGKIKNGKFWIPSIVTLPTAMVYPITDEDDNTLKWAYAEMVDIPEDEQKDYPDPNGGYYKKRYDAENCSVYDEFYIALTMVNKNVERAKGLTELELPKLNNA